ncbi:MAG: hypothetical protein L6Q83_07695, partial [Gammaproteobacteria bacterium]|nr:hypothetical protein [Gammaproteobacteria bacterium]
DDSSRNFDHGRTLRFSARRGNIPGPRRADYRWFADRVHFCDKSAPGRAFIDRSLDMTARFAIPSRVLVVVIAAAVT